MISTHRPIPSKKLLCAMIFCAVLTITFFSAGQVKAQDNGLSMSVQVGYDGYCKQSAWLPIHVEIQNSGSDLDGVIEASYQQGSGEQSSSQTKIELPSTSRKDLFLYIYVTEGYIQKFSVKLLDGKRVVKQVNQSLNCLSKENLVFGLVTDKPSSYDALNDVQPLGGYVRVAQLNLADLPDQVQAWNSLDALVISNTDTAILKPSQKQALRSWIASGGKLLLIGGFSWQGTAAGLKDWIPLALNATRPVTSLSQLQKYVQSEQPLNSEIVLATGTLAKDAQVLVYQDGIPVLIQKPIGFGSVYFFAADPALQPLAGWTGMKDLYEHLLSYKVQPLPWSDGFSSGYQINQALGAIPQLQLPPAIYIWCLLGLYIVIIGPLNYFVLRRLKRRELAWISIPLLVILFSSLAYTTGFFYRGTTPILNRLAVAEAWDGEDQAQVHGIVGIYSPVRAKYTLKANDQFFLQPFNVNGDPSQANDAWTTVKQDASMLLPEIQGEIGAMKAVAVEGNIAAIDIKQSLVIDINDASPQLTGTLTNKSATTLHDAILVTPGNWTRLQDFAPGQTKTINMFLSMNAGGPSFYDATPLNILQLNESDIQNGNDAARRNAFLEVLLSSGNGVNRGNGGIYVMGWVDNIPLPADLQSQRTRKIDTLLYVHKLTPMIKMQPGKSKLPPSMFMWESSTPDVSPYHASQVPPSGYVLRFQPVTLFPADAVQSIDLYISSNANLQELAVSAWDFNLKTWVHIPLAGSLTHIEDAARFAGPNGEIRIQVISRSSGWTEIQGSYITVTVKP